MNLTCTACHGSRVNDEYKGKNKDADGKLIKADVHYNPGGLDLHQVPRGGRSARHGGHVQPPLRRTAAAVVHARGLPRYDHGREQSTAHRCPPPERRMPGLPRGGIQKLLELPRPVVRRWDALLQDPAVADDVQNRAQSHPQRGATIQIRRRPSRSGRSGHLRVLRPGPPAELRREADVDVCHAAHDSTQDSAECVVHQLPRQQRPLPDGGLRSGG